MLRDEICQNERETIEGNEPGGSGESGSSGVYQFQPELYNALENIAQQKKVPLAWVREAAKKYIAEIVMSAPMVSALKQPRMTRGGGAPLHDS